MDLVLAGRYELEVPLGRGSSGEVWRGCDLATHRPVAIKLVEVSQVDDVGRLSETIERFRREASIISGLRHPNIVGAVDAGRVGSLLFMVMDLAPGISLAAMMDERGARGMGLFPVSSVLRIAEQVCTGLAVAHTAGVVHRDIKPSNLMVTPSLGVKIIDFGTARLVADNSSRLTLPEQTVGTIAYMSPEQAQGLEVDGRSDLYSLGCVLYQLLSGHPPFFSTLPSALLMMQVMDRPVPLGTVRPELPPEVCQLVSDLLGKERESRPADAREVASRVAAIRETFGDEETEFEADRPTIGAHAFNATLSEGLTAAPGRSTVLTPERIIQLSGPNNVLPARREPAAGQPFGQLVPFQVPPPMATAKAGDQAPLAPRAVAQTDPLGGGAAGAGASALRWPDALPPRRRSWPVALAVALAAVLVAGGGAYYWMHTHEALKITKVVVSTANAGVACNGRAHLTGKITTNGRGGTIEYKWVLNGKAKGALLADADSGSDSVKVALAWTLLGKGTGKDIAQLDILSPQRAQSSITIPYVCL